MKRAASGYEVELRIVIDSIVPFDNFLSVLNAFDGQYTGTRLRISTEVLSGVWKSLLNGQANLAIGGAYDGPEIWRMNGGFRTSPLGMIEWLFAVARDHPLADAPEPLPAGVIAEHRAIAVGNTGRTLPQITAGLLYGQETLTVPSIEAKLSAQIAGLGCGHLPRSMAMPYIAAGVLREKQTVEAKPDGLLQIAWRESMRGKSMKWLIDHLAQPQVREALLKCPQKL